MPVQSLLAFTLLYSNDTIFHKVPKNKNKEYFAKLILFEKN